MASQSRLSVWPCAVMLGLLAGVLVALPATAAEPESSEALIRAQLEAGEFAPALAAAKTVENVQQRDTYLAQIAEAQATAGARDASLRTTAEIYDDRARTEVLSRLATQPLGGRGGGSGADFDSLTNLIVTTIDPLSWEDQGGTGSIADFETGVRVDAQGVLRRVIREEATGTLDALRARSATGSRGADARVNSPLRKVSLPRLEKAVQLRQAAGRRPTEAMQVLAGLQRIEYVFVYPDSADVVLAGPAGDWTTDAENRLVSTETAQPILRLDDLVVVLRQMTGGGDTKFGCLIDPSPEALARLQAFRADPDVTPATHGRTAWVERLRSLLGKQQIEVYGLDPRTRAAGVMVEADYRMKLVGMGLEDGVPGVESYLDSIEIPPGGSPPPMGVLRWWFTLNYDAVLASQDRRAFAVRGQGVKVQSENEKLAAEGRRVHTGASEPLNRRFARSFTEHFAALCEKYPVYADLRNLCDLALVGALLHAEDLAVGNGWHMTYFGSSGAYRVELGPAPKEVETVANFRVIRDRTQIHTIAGVSGGVRVDPVSLVSRSAIETDRAGMLSVHRSTAEPEQLPPDAWWWD